MWSLVPEAYYDEAVSRVLPGEENAEMRRQVEAVSYTHLNENGGNSHELRISARIPSVHNNTGHRAVAGDRDGRKRRKDPQ